MYIIRWLGMTKRAISGKTVYMKTLTKLSYEPSTFFKNKDALEVFIIKYIKRVGLSKKVSDNLDVIELDSNFGYKDGGNAIKDEILKKQQKNWDILVRISNRTKVPMLSCLAKFNKVKKCNNMMWLRSATHEFKFDNVAKWYIEFRAITNATGIETIRVDRKIFFKNDNDITFALLTATTSGILNGLNFETYDISGMWTLEEIPQVATVE